MIGNFMLDFVGKPTGSVCVCVCACVRVRVRVRVRVCVIIVCLLFKVSKHSL